MEDEVVRVEIVMESVKIISEKMANGIVRKSILQMTTTRDVVDAIASVRIFNVCLSSPK